MSHSNDHGTEMAPHIVGILCAQWEGGSGKIVVRLARDGVHNTLKDMKLQWAALQEKVDSLIQCVEMEVDVGLDYATCGRGKLNQLFVSDRSLLVGQNKQTMGNHGELDGHIN